MAIRGETAHGRIISSGLAFENYQQRAGRDEGAEDLGDHISEQVLDGKPSRDGQSDGNGGVQVTARHIAQRVHAPENRQSKRERHTEQPNADLREGRGEHSTPATAKHQNESAYEFRGDFSHVFSLSQRRVDRGAICLRGLQRPSRDEPLELHDSLVLPSALPPMRCYSPDGSGQIEKRIPGIQRA
jgi:hypothetical protein